MAEHQWLESSLERVRCPAIVLQGGSDVVVAPAAGRALAAALGAELVELEGQGHLLPRDAADELAAAVERLLEAVGTVGWEA